MFRYSRVCWKVTEPSTTISAAATPYPQAVLTAEASAAGASPAGALLARALSARALPAEVLLAEALTAGALAAGALLGGTLLARALLARGLGVGVQPANTLLAGAFPGRPSR